MCAVKLKRENPIVTPKSLVDSKNVKLLPSINKSWLSLGVSGAAPRISYHILQQKVSVANDYTSRSAGSKQAEIRDYHL